MKKEYTNPLANFDMARITFGEDPKMVIAKRKKQQEETSPRMKINPRKQIKGLPAAVNQDIHAIHMFYPKL